MVRKIRSKLGIASLACAAFAPVGAWAQGYSADIELVVPDLSDNAMPGVAVAGGLKPGTVRLGVNAQYALNPLVLYDFDEYVGAVISNRVGLLLGGSVDVARAFTIRAALPLAANIGTQVDRYAAGGFGVGDARLGATVAFYQRGVANLGARLDLAFPTGRKSAYIGEDTVRGTAAFLAQIDVGRFDVATDIGVTARKSVRTTEMFRLAPELAWNTGVRYFLVDEKFALSANAYARLGLLDFGGAGESSLEAMLDAEIHPSPAVRIDIGLGRGLNRGYGTSDVRALVGFTWRNIPPDRKPEVVAEATTPPPDPTRFQINTLNQDLGEPEKVEWAEGQLARIDKERIKIRDNINFVVGTAQILDESQPTLTQVAGLLNGNALIGQVVIEGFASEEGEYAYNYELSLDRAESIFRRLVELGVHPTRISFRAFGELNPRKTGEDEASLEANRRVEFRIVRQLEDFEVPPPYPREIQLPWSGESQRIITPTLPLPDASTPIELQFQQPAEDALEDVQFGTDEDEIEMQPEEPK
jgi:outer membrane protein OmpA-like peptidoglycan-associated protein